MDTFIADSPDHVRTRLTRLRTEVDRLAEHDFDPWRYNVDLRLDRMDHFGRDASRVTRRTIRPLARRT